MAYKTCSKCNAQCGPRKAVCDCGNPFPMKDKEGGTSIAPTSPTISSPTSNKSNIPTISPANSFLNLAGKNPPSISEVKPQITRSTIKTVIEELPTKTTNKRNCLLCNSEYESEDSRIDEYGKVLYYYKYARYCSSNCLGNSDQIKTDIIVDILEFLGTGKAKLLEYLKKDIKFTNVLKGIDMDIEDAEEYQKYIDQRPKINILSPQKKKLVTSKDFKNEGIEMPLLKNRKIEEPATEPTKKGTNFFDMVND